MDKRAQEFARTRWKVMQWGAYAVAAFAAIGMLWMNYAGTLNGPAIIALAWVIFCGCAVGFVTWYVRWYFSDAFVVSAAKRALGCRPEFIEEVMKDHPRRAEILEEMERQRVQ